MRWRSSSTATLEIILDCDLTVTTLATTGHDDTVDLKLVAGATFKQFYVRHVNSGMIPTDQSELHVPNVSQQVLYQHSGHGGNGGASDFDLDVLGYTMPNGGA
jgi:hypothetical protein